MRTACYRAVLPKIDRQRSISAVGGQLRKQSIVGGRLRKKKRKKKKRKRRKKKRRRKNTVPSLPARRRCPRVARVPSPPSVSARGEKDRGDIVNDLKFTVTHAVEPMEKGLTRFNQKLHKISQNIRKHDKKLRTKDDSCIGSSSPTRRVHGIDDSLLDGSISDSGSKRGRRHRWKSGYTSAESGGESSDHGHGRYEIHGHRWITRD
ncbi:hypothetical protein BHM03_00043831 [Ensete ventricosum]|nr:hypothetical protein BHM03_00043831 [Ensete ventricosum]